MTHSQTETLSSEQLWASEGLTAVLQRAFDSGDAGRIQAVLGDVVRIKGVTYVAKEVGMSRQALYKALREEGNPSFALVLKVLRALNVEVGVRGGGWPEGQIFERPET